MEVTSLKKKMAISKAASVAAKAEMEATLAQTKSLAVDAILHTRAALIEEFKVG